MKIQIVPLHSCMFCETIRNRISDQIGRVLRRMKQTIFDVRELPGISDVRYEFTGKNFRGKNNAHTNHFHFKCHTITSDGKEKKTSFVLTAPLRGTL